MTRPPSLVERASDRVIGALALFVASGAALIVEVLFP